MVKIVKIVRDPFWQGLAAIVAISVAVLSQCSTPAKAMCDEPVFETVVDANLCGVIEKEVLVSPEIIKSCRKPSFGIELWSQTHTTTEASGWRGGGSNPTNWCNELAAKFLKQRSIGSDSRTAVVGQPSEESNKDWKGHVTYNYHCTIKADWAPIYNVRQDPLCGITPAQTKIEKEPKSCKKKIGTKKVECSDTNT